LKYDISGSWLYVKLGLVTALMAYHLWCGVLCAAFRADRNRRGHVWYRWFNEVPTLLLISIVVLVVVKPI
jgi:putative membrane protein